MTDFSSLTLRDLATSIATGVTLAAEAVALGEMDIAERLVDRVRAEMAEVEKRVKGRGRPSGD